MVTLIAKFMGPTWGPSGVDRTQVGPMLAPWTLLSGNTWICFALFPTRICICIVSPSACVTPLTSCMIESEIPDFTFLPLYSFCCSFMVDLFELHKCRILWWCTIVNWASPKMLWLTKKQHKPYSFLYLWITSMAVIPETVLLSQASCIGLTQPYSLDGRSRWFLRSIATVPHMDLYVMLDMLKVNFL